MNAARTRDASCCPAPTQQCPTENRDAASTRDKLVQLSHRIVYEVEVLGIHVANVGGSYGMAKMVLAVLDD